MIYSFADARPVVDRADDDDEDEADRLLEQSEANAKVIRAARTAVEWAGDRATPEMRAALKAAEAEDARLVKLWLAVQAARAKRLRGRSASEPRSIRSGPSPCVKGD